MQILVHVISSTLLLVLQLVHLCFQRHNNGYIETVFENEEDSS